MIILVVGLSIAIFVFFVELHTRRSGAPKFAKGIEPSELHETSDPEGSQGQTQVVWM